MSKFNKIQLITTKWFDTKLQNATLNNHSRCICALFARLLQDEGFEFLSGRGLIVSYYPVVKGNAYYLTDSGWHYLSTNKDIRSFIKLTNLEQKKYFLQQIEQSFLALNEYIDFDLGKILNVVEKIKLLNYENSWEWKEGGKLSPNKQWKSEVHVTFEIDYICIVIEVQNIRNESKFRKEIQIDKGDDFTIDQLLGKAKWLSNNEFSLFSKEENEEPITILIESQEIKKSRG